MGKRKVDPTTGESRLTHREERLVDELIKNGGNGARAAAAAGYGTARADQSAYQVLQRPEVQRRIRQRIAESRVSADEIIGTLASFMRGTLADFLDESGSFSIEAAKERGVDHLLKSITTATREIQATKNAPAQTVRTCRGQLYSPIQAAIALARILGIDRNGGRRSRSRASYSDQDEFRSALSADFNVGSWLEDLIQQQMSEQGLPRDTVVESLLRVRPEIAKYLRELPDPRKSARDSRTTTTATRPAPVLDFIAALAADSQASPGSNPVTESALLIQTLSNALNIGAITSQAFEQAIDRIIDRLSDEQRGHLDDILQLEAIFLDAMAASDSTRSAPPKSHPTESDPTRSDFCESGRTHSDRTDSGPTEAGPAARGAVHSKADVSDSRPPNLQPATCNLQPIPNLQPRPGQLPPGLERYIHPTDYLTPVPDTWPPTRNPWPQTANQCPPVTDQQAAGARSRHYKNSQSFSMSSPHYAGPPPPPDFAPSDLEGDDEDDECESSPSFSMSRPRGEAGQNR
ncbi:MAG TPA: terminase small subunit [Blastocatellia bacterium]|nr:terminase small subunit [Blastocatellia bacterium]